MKRKGQNVAKNKKKPVAKKTVKKAAKKAAVKKVAAKKPMKKAATKPLKKTPAKKTAPKKTAIKKPAQKASAKPVAKATPAKTGKAPTFKVLPFKTAKEAKPSDLSDFVTPLDDRLMVQTTGMERVTAGGLYIPDTAADVSGNVQGFVVSVGRGHRNKKGQVRPMDVKVGDKVLFAQHTGSLIKIQDKDFLILREGDVLGIIGSN